MRTLTKALASLLLLVMIGGCTTVKRFKSADYKGEDHSLVDMTLFGASLDRPGLEPKGHNLWDLSADAQTQLIRIYNARYPDNGQFDAALKRRYFDDGFGVPADFTGMDLKMVFTISKEKDYTVIGESGSRFSPADRIESMKFSLEIPDEYNLQFMGWNRYSTEYGEFEIADVSFSRSIDLGADVSTEFLDGSLKSSSARKEDQVLRARYMKLNGNISPRRIEMEAEGCREIDLAGNVLADVSLEFEGFPERVSLPVFVAGSDNHVSQLAQLNFEDVLVPRMKDAPDSIMATLEMEYVYRHVESGWKTYQEWDDRVAFYSGKVTKQVPLFGRDEYLPPLFCLGNEEMGTEVFRVRVEGTDYPLQFIAYKDAQRFMEWLRGISDEKTDREMAQAEGEMAQTAVKVPVVNGECSLLFGGRVLSPALIAAMKNIRVLPVY